MNRLPLERLCSVVLEATLLILLCLNSDLAFGSVHESFAWIEARGRVQHLNALQSSSVVSLPQSKINSIRSAPSSALDCAVRKHLARIERKQCIEYLTEASIAKTAESERSRLLLAIYNLITSEEQLSWKDSIALSGSAAILHDPHLAKNILNKAIKEAAHTQPEWVLQRLNLYALVIDVQSAKEIQKRREIFNREIPNFQRDVLFSELILKLESILPRNDQSSSTTDKLSPQALLQELGYKRWQLAQDRDELTVISKMFEKKDLDVFDFHRLDQLVGRYNSSDLEWKAIMNLLSGMTTGVESLMRSGVLQMMMEHWIANSAPRGVPLESDQDRALSRSRLVLDELSVLLKRMIRLAKREQRFEPIHENLGVLEKRMNSLQTTLSIALNDSLVERDLRAAQAAQDQLFRIEKRIRRAQALLAGSSLGSPLDMAESGNLNSIRAEIDELESQKRQLLFEFFKIVLILQPNVQKEFRALIRIKTQIKSSLRDFRSLLSSVDHHQRVSPSAAALFIDEADALLEKVEADASRGMAFRRLNSAQIIKAIGPLQLAVERINSEFRNILRSSAAGLRPILRRLIATIDAALIDEMRKIEWRESIAQATLRDEVAKSIDAVRTTQERLEILRRIRSENLEWRLAQ